MYVASMEFFFQLSWKCGLPWNNHYSYESGIQEGYFRGSYSFPREQRVGGRREAPNGSRISTTIRFREALFKTPMEVSRELLPSCSCLTSTF